jgi:hypothetical protein
MKAVTWRIMAETETAGVVRVQYTQMHKTSLR